MPPASAPSKPAASPEALSLAFAAIQELLCQDNGRGMPQLVRRLPAGHLREAALALLQGPATCVIATGFPVGGQPETDGPPGALALAQAFSRLGRKGVLCSWEQVTMAVQALSPGLQVRTVPRGRHVGKKLDIGEPFSLVTIEACGRTRDGRYLNMRGVDVADDAPWFEDWLGEHALVSIGDGGNEFGMGTADDAFFRDHPVQRPISTCRYLLPAPTSNDGAYALVAALALVSGDAGLLPSAAEQLAVLEALHAQGFVDGFSGEVVRRVDGRPFPQGLSSLSHLERIVGEVLAPGR